MMSFRVLSLLLVASQVYGDYGLGGGVRHGGGRVVRRPVIVEEVYDDLDYGYDYDDFEYGDFDEFHGRDEYRPRVIRERVSRPVFVESRGHVRDYAPRFVERVSRPSVRHLVRDYVPSRHIIRDHEFGRRMSA